jgi:DNA-binding IclR family transcriptional regulator
MTLTKFEEYIDIIRILAQEGSLKLTQIAAITKIEEAQLQQLLNFLIEQEIVKEKPYTKTALYTASYRGMKILKFFRIETSLELL